MINHERDIQHPNKDYYCIPSKNNSRTNWYSMLHNGISNFRMILVTSVNKCIPPLSKLTSMFKNYPMLTYIMYTDQLTCL